ncbi:Exopolysaccharide production protein ExoQ [Rubellimicrobium mesophilum DSM 19309]|uniref:Exopolysaccharide production protein ExoQ n=1 Tax=Rubellimicrobium mesophilum DSM 19309 TaxID=442562 RepID=A0A017HKQ6_9RHOB|nr:O-antigen ligase family protein [Rubellimicrobium mesophilum]EYD74936.1 Exopolysaccharide production protein ExoQ [Rubellimicrobium mesophilum DSM 19309]
MASMSDFSPLQKAIVVLVVLGGTETIRTFAGAAAERSLMLALLIPMVAITVLYTRHLVRTSLAVPELIVLHVFAVVSVSWSVAPHLTLIRALPLLVTSCFMLTIASMFSMRQVLLLLGAIATCTALASLLAVALIPSARGTPPWDTVWRGVFNHKNALGSSSSFGLLLAAGAALVSQGQGRLRKFLILGALLNAYLLLVSESRTSQITTIFGFGLLGVTLVTRRKLASAAIILLVVTLTTMVVYSAFSNGWLDPVFAMVGRKPTLSGRIPLWEVTWPFVKLRPWLGWGYLAFWDPESTRVMAISQSPAIWYVPFYSHNGLIETLLNVGVVGLMLLALLLTRVFGGILGILGTTADRRELVVFFAFILCFLLHNATESSILERDGIMWMQFTLITAKLGLVAKASSRQGPALAPAPSLRRAGA